MSAKSGREWKKSRRAGGRCALQGFQGKSAVNPAKASNRLNKVRDLTKEPLIVPRRRLWRLWRLPRPWARLSAGWVLATAGLIVALRCGAEPAIVALQDGRQFGAAGDLAYVLDMPLDAAVGSRWHVVAPPSGANLEDRRGEDRRGGDRLARLPADAPTHNLGTVELVSRPAVPRGLAVVTVVSSVREVVPGSVLVPLPAGHAGVEWIAH